MKIFLGWSGETSHAVANALHQWLPYMLQPLRPFVSTDIAKGDRWPDSLEGELSDSEFGIFCITKYNFHKPWLLFEAGVLRGALKASVIPFLFDVDGSTIPSPLSQFQSAAYSRNSDGADVLRLVRSINERLGPSKIDEVILTNTFPTWWEKLKKELDAIHSSQDETQTSYEWLYTFDDLALREERTDSRELWIITSDIEKFATGFEGRRRLTNLIQNGVKVRFYTRDGVDEKSLNELQEATKDLLEYGIFDKQDFDIHAVTDYIIVNPDGKGGPLRMFLKLPMEDHEFWMEVDRHSAEKFRLRFQSLWDSSGVIRPGAEKSPGLQKVATAQ